jgi:hypothetical protein
MAYEASQIPHGDVQGYFFENLSDEENPQDRHFDMPPDYLLAASLNRESVKNTPRYRCER